ncbi:LysR family transcriptional regulator [Serratia marcescens]|uniref:LysR family transcriptional regulator n=1 Tax=Serratia marcescens TaxID=615 RepID=UPI001C58D7B0|nr:LysR family transcriptional regulator [Serratia marcescens]QXX98122.1 LysR family transcriptional regulator [Serratia marcescens]
MDVLLTMRAFRRLVERNSFYKAAEDLAITPAALSKQIKQLENRLGTLLLVRTTRSMSLTEAGQLYYQEACRLLGEFDALEQTVAASAQQVSGTLRVNAPLSFGLTVLSPLLPPFMQHYPQLQVELTLDDRVLDVVAAGFDISLRIRRRLPDSSLSARALGEVHQRICAAPGYLAQHGVPQTPNDLPRHSCLAYSLAERPGQWQFTAGEDSLSVTFTPRLIANNSLMLRDMLVAGLGIGSLPSFVADPDIAAGRLVRLFPEQIADVHQIFAVYPTRRHVQQKVSLFTEFVREQGLMTAN